MFLPFWLGGLNKTSGLVAYGSYWEMNDALFMILLWGVRYTDLGPFRAISFRALRSLDLRDRNYGWTVEMQIKASIHGLRSKEVPVRYRKRIGKSKVSGTLKGVINAGIKILYTIFKFAIETRKCK